MLCQVFGKVPGTKQPSGEYTNRFHGNSYVPNTRQGEERLPWDHTHQKVVFPVYELRMYAGENPNVWIFFRHTFATECICRWMREGRDIDAMLPFLSAYMGHARYEDTLYYVHMVPDFYERVGTVDRTAWEKLLPEVHDEG